MIYNIFISDRSELLLDFELQDGPADVLQAPSARLGCASMNRLPVTSSILPRFVYATFPPQHVLAAATSHLEISQMGTPGKTAIGNCCMAEAPVLCLQSSNPGGCQHVPLFGKPGRSLYLQGCSLTMRAKGMRCKPNTGP